MISLLKMGPVNLQGTTDELERQDKALEICCATTELSHYSCSFFVEMRSKFYNKSCRNSQQKCPALHSVLESFDLVCPVQQMVLGKQ